MTKTDTGVNVSKARGITRALGVEIREVLASANVLYGDIIQEEELIKNILHVAVDSMVLSTQKALECIAGDYVDFKTMFKVKENKLLRTILTTAVTVNQYDDDDYDNYDVIMPLAYNLISQEAKNLSEVSHYNINLVGLMLADSVINKNDDAHIENVVEEVHRLIEDIGDPIVIYEEYDRLRLYYDELIGDIIENEIEKLLPVFDNGLKLLETIVSGHSELDLTRAAEIISEGTTRDLDIVMSGGSPDSLENEIQSILKEHYQDDVVAVEDKEKIESGHTLDEDVPEEFSKMFKKNNNGTVADDRTEIHNNEKNSPDDDNVENDINPEMVDYIENLLDQSQDSTKAHGSGKDYDVVTYSSKMMTDVFINLDSSHSTSASTALKKIMSKWESMFIEQYEDKLLDVASELYPDIDGKVVGFFIRHELDKMVKDNLLHTSIGRYFELYMIPSFINIITEPLVEFPENPTKVIGLYKEKLQSKLTEEAS